MPITLSKINTILKSNSNKSFTLLLIGLFIYQMLFIFQGFELCDSGFYATFYQNIFDDPSSVETNFPYWFTGIIGGLFIKIFPEGGLLGIRILGVINILAINYLVYFLLKDYIDLLSLYLGLLVVTISFVGMPTEFYHNNLTTLFFVASAIFLFKGLKKNNYLSFALSGFMIAINTFTRLPNILDIGLIFIT